MKKYKRYVIGGVFACLMAVALMMPIEKTEAFWPFSKAKTENNINYTGAVANVKKSGLLSVITDSSSPAYHIVASGTSNAILGILKISANGEQINLNKIEFKMSDKKNGGAKLSQSSNIYKLTLWDNQTQVGETIFAGMNKNATITAESLAIIPKDGYKTLVIKADLAEIGQTYPGQQGALIAVDYVKASGVGQQSGVTIKSKSRATSFDGIRMFKSFPVVNKVLVPTNTLNNGQMSIYRFKVSADSVGSIGLYKLTLQIATSTAYVKGLNVYAYADSGFLTPVSDANAGGRLMNKDILNLADKADINILIDKNGKPAVLQIPANETRYFDVVGVISGVETGKGAFVSTRLRGDGAYPVLSTLMGTYLEVEKESGKNNNFVWSPNATTSALITHRDWTNSYGVFGLPPDGLAEEVLSK